MQLSQKRLLSVTDAIIQDVAHNRSVYFDFLNNTDPYLISLTRELSTFDGLKFGVEFYIKKPVVEPTTGMLITQEYQHEIDITCYQISDTGDGNKLWANPFVLSENQKNDILKLVANCLLIKAHCAVIISQELENSTIYEVSLLVAMFRVTMMFRRPYRVDKNRPAASAEGLEALVESVKGTIDYVANTSRAINPPFREMLEKFNEELTYRTIVDACEPPPKKNVTDNTLRKKIARDIPIEWPVVLMARPNKEEIEQVTQVHPTSTKIKRQVDL